MTGARAINWVEQGYLPDNIIRKGIRRLLKERLQEIHADDVETANAEKQKFIADMHSTSIALETDKANEQHYEVPAEFFNQVLGDHNKYSCCYWDKNTHSLEQAEKKALQLSAEHAGLGNGQSVLELGCGWGSLSLWMAQQYPDSQITSVSNSKSQKNFIDKEAKRLNLINLNVITCDINDFDINKQFDRIVSIEMFEHTRNWNHLYANVAKWLKPDGQFFLHIFVHRSTPYAFEVKDSSDWMSKYFFTGGMMPSADLPLYFQNNLKLENNWAWNGNHYAHTCNAWLKNMDAKKQLLMPVFKYTYGSDVADIWWMRWRLFFMACAELFAYDDGQQWFVNHYLFSRR
jgi:cyclopropane-fatty-acyl-phospholipid synthase